MNKVVKPLLLSIVIIILPYGNVIAEQENNQGKIYTFGVVPQFDARRVYAIWRPILDELQKRTGLQFTLRGSSTIPQFELEFAAGKFDFAYMNPYQVTLDRNPQKYIPMLRDIGRSLHGIVVVQKDSPIKSVTELANNVMAFPAPNALGATLLIRSEFLDKHHIKVNPKYVQTHNSVYLHVALGEVIAGGGVQKTLNQQSSEVREALRIIYRSGDVAAHPITAHPRVTRNIRKKIHNALLAMSKTKQGKKLLEKVPVKKLGNASRSDYEPLTRMNLKRFH